MPLFRRLRISLLAVVWAVSFWTPRSFHAEPDDPSASPFVPWHFEALSSRRHATAIALSADGEKLAFATPSGVWLQGLGVQSGEARRVPLRDAEVRDLRFAEDGALWVGTDVGLFVVGLEGRTVDRSPAPGSGREIRRFSQGSGRCALAATGRGVFEETPTGAWRQINGEAPDQDVTALVCEGSGNVWLVSGGDLYELASKSLENGTNSVVVQRHVLPGLHEPILDLAGNPEAGDGPLVLTSRRLFRRLPNGQWTGLDLPLAPGVDARRILRAAGRLWIAAERGLYEAPAAAGPWRLADESLSGWAFTALASRGTNIAAAGERGVIEGTRVAPQGPSTRSEFRRPPTPLLIPQDPSRADLQRAVLDYLELDRGPGRSLAARARARGWLPAFELRGAYGGARRRDLDYDQTFTSGEDRLFLDRDRSRSRDFDVAAVLRWDLGDTVFHPEELDVAKERREVIELRDEVLDEVHRLYFERQRVLLAWAAIGDAGVPEARALALRADELGAGLDAWTGGWWNARVPSLFSSRLDLESTK